MSNDYISKLFMLPKHMQDSVKRWIEHGSASHPGDFLSAFLSNDLMETFSRADDINSEAIRNYCIYFYCFAPPGCYGSVENFKSWKGLLCQEKLLSSNQTVKKTLSR